MANTNPWSNTADAAMDALFKHYMTKPQAPDPREVRNQELQNQMIGANIDRIDTQTELDRRRLDAASGLGDLISSFYESVPVQGPTPSGAPMAPMAPTDEMVGERIRGGRADLARTAANYGINSPTGIADVFAGLLQASGAPADMVPVTGSAPTLSAPVKNYNFRQKLVDEGVDPRQFDAYVRANQKADLGDVIQFISGTTGETVTERGKGTAPKVTVQDDRVITTPGTAMGARPVSGTDPLTASRDAILNRQEDIGANQYQRENLTPTQPDGTLVQELPASPKKREASTRVTGILTDIAQKYNALDEVGGAISTENAPGENIMARIGASGIGQAVGGAVGSEAQSLRNQINSAKPLLINYIRQASEMGARGLDSEKELQFYLEAATNEKKDIQANMAALSRLDEAYGLGANVNANPEALEQLKQEFQASLAGEGTLTPEGTGGPTVGTIEEGYEFLGGDPGNSENWRLVQ